jgi:hypothetical protein
MTYSKEVPCHLTTIRSWTTVTLSHSPARLSTSAHAHLLRHAANHAGREWVQRLTTYYMTQTPPRFMLQTGLEAAPGEISSGAEPSRLRSLATRVPAPSRTVLAIGRIRHGLCRPGGGSSASPDGCGTFGDTAGGKENTDKVFRTQHNSLGRQRGGPTRPRPWLPTTGYRRPSTRWRTRLRRGCCYCPPGACGGRCFPVGSLRGRRLGT